MKDQNIKEKRVVETTRTTDANRDPITGAPGAHPVGTGVGAAGGGAAGAAIGLNTFSSANQRNRGD